MFKEAHFDEYWVPSRAGIEFLRIQTGLHRLVFIDEDAGLSFRNTPPSFRLEYLQTYLTPRFGSLVTSSLASLERLVLHWEGHAAFDLSLFSRLTHLTLHLFQDNGERPPNWTTLNLHSCHSLRHLSLTHPHFDSMMHFDLTPTLPPFLDVLHIAHPSIRVEFLCEAVESGAVGALKPLLVEPQGDSWTPWTIVRFKLACRERGLRMHFEEREASRGAHLALVGEGGFR